jgi:urease accessory protein
MQTAVVHNSSQASSAVAWLQLLHLADSALPIGALAHSFGIETLVAEVGLSEADLPAFFAAWLSGTGCIEASFCLRASATDNQQEWQSLNIELSSFKPARESREASLRLGKRFLALAAGLIERPSLERQGDVHLATAFGLAGAALDMEPAMVASAYLHQTIFGAISACQRLMPLGQFSAMRLLWALKPGMIEAVEAAGTATNEGLWNLQPMLEIASMRHPHLTTRLFIS